MLDAEGLPTEAMQAIARWTNLSETTFVFPPTVPEADYRLRIFTPQSELPFAGHPTLGTAHAILEERDIRRPVIHLVQECELGLVDVTVEEGDPDGRVTLGLPAAHFKNLQNDDISELQSILNYEFKDVATPAVVNVGAIWVVAQLDSAAAVLDLSPDFARMAEFERRLGVTGVTVFGHHDQGDAEIEVRTFAPSCGVEEDPVCGSGNGSVAVFRRERSLIPSQGAEYVATQGRRVGRDGRIHVRVDADGAVHLGGSCITTLHGTLAL
ncbi:phenazine biosynthesis protein PhzF family [Streptomyces iranensis]|uniref:Phenazine biosynthesis protein PhzF family n=1 Tax=Streptomyces iranensis TaxID=576784 RepID=A0A060ZV63_9ACTN|nr:phenazine biosynthesis protein PhzF family [Streptomyces iranensis]